MGSVFFFLHKLHIIISDEVKNIQEFRTDRLTFHHSEGRGGIERTTHRSVL